MNHTLLIVDDEPEILEWLEELFLYDYKRETEVHTASSAHEALKLLNEIRFDVVLTDIRMPGMDGITLFEKIKENWPKCKTVFLTGYRDFDHIYRIIQNKDVQYVLKSEDDEVILEAVEKSFRQVIQELENSDRENQYEKAKLLLQRETFKKALKEKADAEEIQKAFDREGIEIRADRPVLAALVRMERRSKEINLPAEPVSLDTLLKENLPAAVCSYCYETDKRYSLILIQPSDIEEDWKRLFVVLQGALEYIQEYVRIRGEWRFSAAVSSEKTWFCGITDKEMYLRNILVCCLGEKEQAVIHAEIMEKHEEASEERSVPGRAGMLKAYLDLRQKKAYYSHLNEICEKLMSYRSIHDTSALELYYSAAVSLLQFINENHLNEELAFRIGLYRLLDLQESESWEEAVKYLYDLSEALFELMGVSENTLTDRALDRLNQYIEENLSGNLSLARLAEIGGFNASYLSRLFKKTYHVAISDYVLKKRMEYAKELLVNTQDKIQDISVKAGYLSSHSFARTFRGYEGVSPIEYRELHAERAGE